MKSVKIIFLIFTIAVIIFIYGAIVNHQYVVLIALIAISTFVFWKMFQTIKSMSGDSIYEKNKVSARKLEAIFKLEKNYKKVNVIIELANGGTEGVTVDGYIKITSDLTRKVYQQNFYQEGSMPGSISQQVSVGISTLVKSFQGIEKGGYSLSVDTGNEGIHVQSIKIVGQ